MLLGDMLDIPEIEFIYPRQLFEPVRFTPFLNLNRVRI